MNRPNHCANPECELARPSVCHPNAFCVECMEPRFAAGGASERMLKCKHCGALTRHAVMGMDNRNDRYDYGEAAFWHPNAPHTHY
jgi:hypothetical protein